MSGEKFQACAKCARVYSVSKKRNADNVFICPDCAMREKARLRHEKPTGFVYGSHNMATVICEVGA